MPELPGGPVTRLLREWAAGEEAALGELTGLLYQELRTLAQRHLRRERPNHTIQKTALVHEAFVRLVDQRAIDWRCRGHFMALASNVMRRILVDHARARRASKRGGGASALSLDELLERGTAAEASAPVEPAQEIEPGAVAAEMEEDLAAIDEALSRLAQLDPRQAQIVEMRYFGGLTIEETAGALEISEATVKREWQLARLWLKRELMQGGGTG